MNIMKKFKTKTDLLPHQLKAVEKLLPSLVGALFAEMGTGKSRMAIEFARLRAKKIDRVLWFCPVSLKETVRCEIMKHTDCEESEVYVFTQTTNERNVPADATWYVIGLESVSQSLKTALTTRGLATEKTFVIVDESAYIKGHRALRTQRLISFCEKCRYRMILTGTPMTQGISDLYSQMLFLSPDILGYKSWYSFEANHLEYHKEKKGLIVATHNVEYLASKMSPYVYQITKKDCLNLPDKLYHHHYVLLSDEQKEAYARAKDDFLQNAVYDAVTGELDRVSIFHLFTSLQSIVCGFWNYNENWFDPNKPRIEKAETYPHNRIDGLLDVIERLPGTEKVIVWTKYRHCTEQTRDALIEAYDAGSVAMFYGALPPKAREEELRRFRNEARFFVATQSCGGHGLTLNEANHVIFYADGFKYSERLQAEDRCHRIGQTKPVTYISIQSGANIEERISKSLAKKSNALLDFKREIDKVKGKGMKEKIKDLVMKL
jgi:SNF2 family DNA or RNA helicase